MLFYRVTSHPVAMRLKSIADAKESKARRVLDEMKRREEAKKAAVEAKKVEAAAAVKAEDAAKAAALQELVVKSTEDGIMETAPSSDTEDPVGVTPASSPEKSLGKRARPTLSSGEEWARVATSLPPEYFPLFVRIQEFITDNVTFSPEFFAYITEEYHRMSSKMSIGRRVKNNKRIKTLLGKGPGGVHPPEDVSGGAADIEGGILDLFHQVSIMYKANNKSAGGNSSGSFLLPKIEEAAEAPETPTKEKASSEDATVVSVAPEVVPAIDTELLIPADNTESYDGAL